MKLTPTQRKLMHHACDRGINPAKLSELADRWNVTEQTVRRNLAGLEAAGFIHERESRKRRSLLRATDTGRYHMSTARLMSSVWLHQRGFPSYTRNPARAMRDAGEVLDPDVTGDYGEAA